MDGTRADALLCCLLNYITSKKWAIDIPQGLAIAEFPPNNPCARPVNGWDSFFKLDSSDHDHLNLDFREGQGEHMVIRVITTSEQMNSGNTRRGVRFILAIANGDTILEYPVNEMQGSLTESLSTGITFSFMVDPAYKHSGSPTILPAALNHHITQVIEAKFSKEGRKLTNSTPFGTSAFGDISVDIVTEGIDLG